jgi:hypothetical protein
LNSPFTASNPSAIATRGTKNPKKPTNAGRGESAGAVVKSLKNRNCSALEGKLCSAKYIVPAAVSRMIVSRIPMRTLVK